MSRLGNLSTFFFADRPLHYTGPELRPHFLYSTLGMKGSALAAFVGSCKVETEHLVDWEDRIEQDRIEAREMVHFLGEFFGWSLSEGVLFQRLAIAILQEQLARQGVVARRSGDDLFIGEGKLSVSIVTASPVSVLLHIGINVDATGAPVRTSQLKDTAIDRDAWIRSSLQALQEEWDSVGWACTKVRPVL